MEISNSDEKFTPTVDWIAEKYYELGGYLITLSTDAHNPQAVGVGHEQKIAMLKQTGFTHILYYKDRKAIPCSL